MASGAAEVTARFTAGDPVRVRRATPPGHTRAPRFIRGKAGVVLEPAGSYRNPEDLAYGTYDGPRLALYRVSFLQTAVWRDYSGSPEDTLIVDVYENWIEAGGR